MTLEAFPPLICTSRLPVAHTWQGEAALASAHRWKVSCRNGLQSPQQGAHAVIMSFLRGGGSLHAMSLHHARGAACSRP